MYHGIVLVEYTYQYCVGERAGVSEATLSVRPAEVLSVASDS